MQVSHLLSMVRRNRGGGYLFLIHATTGRQVVGPALWYAGILRPSSPDAPAMCGAALLSTAAGWDHGQGCSPEYYSWLGSGSGILHSYSWTQLSHSAQVRRGASSAQPSDINKATVGSPGRGCLSGFSWQQTATPRCSLQWQHRSGPHHGLR